MANHNTSSARFTVNCTEAQKQAILKASILEGHKLSDVRRMAEAGQLDVPAFKIGPGIYDLVRRNRDTFEAQNYEALAASTRTELQRLHRLNMADSRRLGKTTDPAERARVAKALAETHKALSTNTPRPGTKRTSDNAAQNNDTTNNTATKVDETLTNLVALADKKPRQDTTQGAETGSLNGSRSTSDRPA